MVVLAFAGRKGSGKDTACDFLVKQYGFEKQSFADPLKEACAVVFDLTSDQLFGKSKDEVDRRYGRTPRHLMQLLGTDWIRDQISDSFWIDKLMRKCAMCSKSVVINDVRFPNEVEAVHRLGGHVIGILRTGCDSTVDSHKSENFEDLDLDIYIYNDSTKSDLYAVVKKCIQSCQGT